MPRSGCERWVDSLRFIRRPRLGLALGVLGFGVLGAGCADEGIEAVGSGPAAFLDAMGAVSGDGRVAIQIVAASATRRSIAPPATPTSASPAPTPGSAICGCSSTTCA